MPWIKLPDDRTRQLLVDLFEDGLSIEAYKTEELSTIYKLLAKLKSWKDIDKGKRKYFTPEELRLWFDLPGWGPHSIGEEAYEQAPIVLGEETYVEVPELRLVEYRALS